MTTRPLRMKFRSWAGQSLAAALCVLLLAPGNTVVYAGEPRAGCLSGSSRLRKFPMIRLDSLVAPIALYPDPAPEPSPGGFDVSPRNYPAAAMAGKHKDLKGDALVAAVEKQDWDPSIQAMAVLPDAVEQLAENIKWTTDLGNAFLAQQNDVMDAVQRMRMKAKDAGTLKSTEQRRWKQRLSKRKPSWWSSRSTRRLFTCPCITLWSFTDRRIYPYPAIYYPPPSYYGRGCFHGLRRRRCRRIVLSRWLGIQLRMGPLQHSQH